MVVDPDALSAEASRIVQERLPICTAIVTQFVTHFGRDLGTPSESRWQWLGFPTPDTRGWTLSQAM